MVDPWNTKIDPCTRSYPVRTANLETYLIIKGLACTLHTNLPIATKVFCYNSVCMPKADPVFPSPGLCFLNSG